MSKLTARKNDFAFVWPLLVDYTPRECYQLLRRLELEAYGKIIGVFRAQGPLTKAKRKILGKLQHLLSIPLDRHKAEVRRALNDEELATISEAICGKEVEEEWILEGKRIAPILHRPSPETAYLSEANRTASISLFENRRLPPPYETSLPPEVAAKIDNSHTHQATESHSLPQPSAVCNHVSDGNSQNINTSSEQDANSFNSAEDTAALVHYDTIDIDEPNLLVKSSSDAPATVATENSPHQSLSKPTHAFVSNFSSPPEPLLVQKNHVSTDPDKSSVNPDVLPDEAMQKTDEPSLNTDSDAGLQAISVSFSNEASSDEKPALSNLCTSTATSGRTLYSLVQNSAQLETSTVTLLDSESRRSSCGPAATTTNLLQTIPSTEHSQSVGGENDLGRQTPVHYTSPRDEHPSMNTSRMLLKPLLRPIGGSTIGGTISMQRIPQDLVTAAGVGASGITSVTGSGSSTGCAHFQTTSGMRYLPQATSLAGQVVVQMCRTANTACSSTGKSVEIIAAARPVNADDVPSRQTACAQTAQPITGKLMPPVLVPLGHRNHKTPSSGVLVNRPQQNSLRQTATVLRTYSLDHLTGSTLARQSVNPQPVSTLIQQSNLASSTTGVSNRIVGLVTSTNRISESQSPPVLTGQTAGHHPHLACPPSVAVLRRPSLNEVNTSLTEAVLGHNAVDLGPSTPGGNNVILLQRGKLSVGSSRANSTGGSQAITTTRFRLEQQQPQQQHESAPTGQPLALRASQPMVVGASTSRQIRIIGMPSSMIAPTSSIAALSVASRTPASISHATLKVTDHIEADEGHGKHEQQSHIHGSDSGEVMASRTIATELTGQTAMDSLQLAPTSSDHISSLLTRASQLNSMLEVDLDADDPVTSHHQLTSDPSHHLGVTGRSANGDGAGGLPCPGVGETLVSCCVPPTLVKSYHHHHQHHQGYHPLARGNTQDVKMVLPPQLTASPAVFAFRGADVAANTVQDRDDTGRVEATAGTTIPSPMPPTMGVYRNASALHNFIMPKHTTGAEAFSETEGHAGYPGSGGGGGGGAVDGLDAHSPNAKRPRLVSLTEPLSDYHHYTSSGQAAVATGHVSLVTSDGQAAAKANTLYSWTGSHERQS